MVKVKVRAMVKVRVRVRMLAVADLGWAVGDGGNKRLNLYPPRIVGIIIIAK